jgi:hypothetical protein
MMNREQIVFAPANERTQGQQPTPELRQRLEFPQPITTLHEVELKMGFNTYHAATIDCGSVVPGTWNLISAAAPTETLSLGSNDAPPPIDRNILRNNSSLEKQQHTIAHARALAESQIRMQFEQRRCKEILVQFYRTEFVNADGQARTGFYVFVSATL